ncbi:MAG: hypothetical protein M1839_002433 [Geoglossum umbratile]|nr:MAG: hypothetical protein M1839_002433 [Geoglossum umbratile]
MSLLTATIGVLAAIANAAPEARSREAILHAASYDGKITTLSLKSTGQGGFELKPIPPPATDAGTSPSWLIQTSKYLYNVDEALSGPPQGTVTEYEDGPQGKLKLRKALKTNPGGVHGALYAGGKALAVAHYYPLAPNSAPGAVTSYRIGDTFQPFPLINFTFAGPGPNPERQEAPHPHQIVVDPTGNYILVPDLGSDLVHVFSINKATGELTKRDPPLKAEAGSGPRHAVFGKGGSFFYLVSELANSVTVYKATTLPNGAGMKFDLVQKTDSFAGAFAKAGKPVPTEAGAAEIALSPCGAYIIVSNRKDNFFSQVNAPADSLATYSIDPTKGTLTPIGTFSATGPVPRQFALNKKGDMAAVGLQGNGMVAVIQYDSSTGKFGKKLADVTVGTQVVCVIWDE